MPDSTFLLHLFTTLTMTGIIWWVQLVHYPLFAEVGAERFVRYENRHVERTGRLVAPLMVLELASGLLLLWFRPAPLAPGLLWIGLALLAGIWASTFALQVPLHDRLRRGFDPRVIERLVASNWIRTVLWSLRAALLLYLTQVLNRG